jgi:zinc protease
MVLIRTLALWVALASAAQAAVFNPQTLTLANGLQVIVVENHRAPVVLHMLWYKVGAADEPAEHAGLAHFFEHMMFKGTNAEPDMDFSATVAALGGEDNAFTGSDFTAYFQTIHPSRLRDVMQMEADRMTDLELGEDDISVEKGVVTQERAQTSTATPEDRWHEAMDAAFYGTHPYARPVIGWNSTIAGYTRAALAGFYQAHYTPSNAVLVVSGDVKAADVFALADATYGQLPGRVVPLRVRNGSMTSGPLRLTHTDADVQQPAVEWRWPAPSTRTAINRTDIYALQILAEMLNTPDNLLQTTLIKQRKMAVAVQAGYDDARYDASTFTLSIAPAPGQDVTALKRVLDTLWPAVLKNINARAVGKAQERLLDSAALARDNIYVPAYAFGLAITTGGTMDDVEGWPAAIAAVTLADVQRVAATLNTAPAMAARLLPEKKD